MAWLADNRRQLDVGNQSEALKPKTEAQAVTLSTGI